MSTKTILMAALLPALCASVAHAGDNRLYMASQYDFGAKTGFYLDFENSQEGSAPAKLSTLKMILAVGDGKDWHFIATTPSLEYGHDYKVRATMADGTATVALDGKTVASEKIDLHPYDSPLAVNDSPGWAQAPAEYVIFQKDLTVTRDGAKPMQVQLGAPSLPIRLFGGFDTRHVDDWRTAPGKPLMIEATFRLDARPSDLKPLSPFVDKYGQSRYAEWPGKMHSDGDLRQSVKDDTRIMASLPASPDYDPYGGYKKAGWHEKATGFFAATQHNGRWWLLSPEGNPTFYTGIDTAPALNWDSTPITGREFLFESLPPRDGDTASAWSENPWGTDPGIAVVALHSANMARKYGSSWQDVEKDLMAKRIKAWAFSGMGKFCDPIPGITDIPVLNTGGVPKIAGHADVFDTAVQDAFRESLRKQIEPRIKDSYVVGWSVGNEYDEIIKPGEVRDILNMPGTAPAKRALADYALDKIYGSDIAKAAAAAGVTAATREEFENAKLTLPDDAIETLRRYYADRYYEFIYRTVKTIDPRHLYLGFWISFGWWVNEEDWRLIGKHCDVIGYDRYDYNFSNKDLDRLAKETGKPTLCGEFSFPPVYRAERGYAFYQSGAEDEAASAKLYKRWMQSAATDPYCVGVGWFQYRDEPLTGRGGGHGTDLVYGEHFAFGLVDVTDRPKWNMLKEMRKANLAAVTQRLQ